VSAKLHGTVDWTQNRADESGLVWFEWQRIVPVIPGSPPEPWLHSSQSSYGALSGSGSGPISQVVSAQLLDPGIVAGGRYRYRLCWDPGTEEPGDSGDLCVNGDGEVVAKPGVSRIYDEFDLP
jgi:hypothetical protein